jgi:large subunit ribosomal protein L14
MIKVESVLRIGDNSGAKLARCIKIIGVGNKKTATCGDVIFITLRKFISSKKVKKRTIYLGLIIGVRY